ncbi:uncharacterized protein LOC111576671 isoform X2 [Amphiprion ocellaris]|uniref:uncharacterized protein LOC111576671 isoform X2 n=1 Tax=Amphiprion ocellaris TaxID=80972 RepID=UPI0024114C35|nr:uncharacterized protein LOC111576671 isoform X2 [Amphiprion ocellaris]
MPSYSFLDNLELFIRTGKFPGNASTSSKKVTKAASKHFLYKDGSLWRTYRGRLLRVVRSDEEVRDILLRYHDNNNHAGRVRMVKEIMLLYYWVGVTEAVKKWIKACTVCQNRPRPEPLDPPVHFCLVYGCDASSYVHPELSFHRFPKEAERRRTWLAVAQRDEGSLRSNSYICSRHFDSSCFNLSDEGQRMLSSDAVPTIVPQTTKEDEVVVPSEDEFLPSNTLEDLLSIAAAAETPESSGPALEAPVGLQEHQYCLPAPDPDSMEVQTVRDLKKRKTIVEPSFSTYNHIARYLSHRVLPLQSKRSRGALKRMSKRFGLIDGELMYTRVSPPVRVPRSREEVNSILQQFHDNQGHYGQGICQREISKHFYWASMSCDLSTWISSCNTCLTRSKRKWLRCSVISCSNCCGPVERGLGLTFHRFPLHDAALLARWLKAVGRSNWLPRLRSSVCSTHFTEDCLDRRGEKVVLRPDAVPTLMVHGDSMTSRGQNQPAGQEEAFFAKYDAVELYLSRRTYPPGLSYVEKNTFRRFCKKFTMKDDKLHSTRGDRLRLVLRSRQQVEAALTDYHDELNHLDVNKCLRLLNERYFWKTMKSDVIQWIDGCFQCSRKKNPETLLHALRSPPISSVKDDQTDDADEGENSEGDSERLNSDTEDGPSTPISPQTRIPILLHLRTPISLQSRTPSAPLVSRPLSVQSRSESHVQVQDPEEDQRECSSSQCVRPAADPPPEKTHRPGEPQAQIPAQNRSRVQHPAETRRTSGLEPVVAPSNKPWPVFTIAGKTLAKTGRPGAEVDSSSAFRSCSRLQARTVIQQCSSAKVKIRPALDGGDAQWAEPTV